MKVENNPKKQFIELMTESTKSNGLSEITSKIVGVLYVEPEEVSLEELSKRTGYSLSGISTEIKLLEGLGFVKRMKKPGSRKVYFFIEKDMMAHSLEMIQKKQVNVILKSKQALPEIIKKYKKIAKTLKEKQELKIMEDYYKQILASEKIFEKMIKMLKRFKK